MGAVNPKIFNAAEASRTLPLVAVVVRDAMQAWKRLQTARRQLRKASARRPAAEVGVLARPSDEDRRLGREIKDLEREIEERKAELEELGCYLRDPEKGLVDFPAFVGSELVYLCWSEGETAVTHYHGMRESFTGRKPLPATSVRQTQD